MITLRHAGASARISTTGAEPRSWTIDGQELLWQADPQWWPKSSPILFPVVGRVQGGVIRVDGQTYPMPLHGFAAASEFAVLGQGEDHVRLQLRDDAASRAQYPFGFVLSVEYRLGARSLTTRFRVENPGDRPLPYALGLHPGFLWSPAPGDAIEFAVAERAEIPVITPDGFFGAARRPVPLAGRHLPLTPELFAREALCFLDACSDSLRFLNGAAGVITVEHSDFPHVALWTRPGAGYLCIESWTGHGDPDGFSGALGEKPSMRILPAGGLARHAVTWHHALA